MSTPNDTAVELPASLRDAVRVEFQRAFHAPYDRLAAVSANAVLMSSAWFFLPTKLKDSLFTIHGSLAFAAVPVSYTHLTLPTIYSV